MLSELEKDILSALSPSEEFLSPYFPVGKLLESREGLANQSLGHFLEALRRLEASGYVKTDRVSSRQVNLHTPVKLTTKGRVMAAKVAEY